MISPDQLTQATSAPLYELPQEELEHYAAQHGVTIVDLKPENNLTVMAWLPIEVHEKIVEQISISPETIIQDATQEFAAKQAETPLTLIGWSHLEGPAHTQAAEYIRNIEHPQQTTICVEYPPTYQKAINNFLEAGTFREGDDPNLYQPLYEHHFGDEIMETIPPQLQGTYFDEFSAENNWGILEIYDVLGAAREKGIRVTAIDERHDMESIDRDAVMLQHMSTEIEAGNGVVALLGSQHINQNGRNYANVPYESVGQLARQQYGSEGMKSWLLQCDNKNLGGYEGVITQPILFDAAKQQMAPGQALHIEPATFPQTPQLYHEVGSDYYVPVL